MTQEAEQVAERDALRVEIENTALTVSRGQFTWLNFWQAQEMADAILAAGFRQTTAAHDAQVRAEAQRHLVAELGSITGNSKLSPAEKSAQCRALWIRHTVPLAIREGEEPKDAEPDDRVCTCDGGALHTPAENARRHPFIRHPDCAFHGESGLT